jgi:hypothetical protein
MVLKGTFSESGAVPPEGHGSEQLLVRVSYGAAGGFAAILGTRGG